MKNTAAKKAMPKGKMPMDKMGKAMPKGKMSPAKMGCKK